MWCFVRPTDVATRAEMSVVEVEGGSPSALANGEQVAARRRIGSRGQRAVLDLLSFARDVMP